LVKNANNFQILLPFNVFNTGLDEQLNIYKKFSTKTLEWCGYTDRYTLCLKKTPHLWLAIIFTHTVRLRQFLAKMLLRK